MSEGFYTFLILSLCTNDITNIRGFAHHIQLNWADQSARNTLVTAERAVRRFENLQVASLLPKIWSKVPGKHHYIVLKIFIISTPPTMQWLHVDDINEYFTKNGCICNNPIIQGHGNFQDLEISMTRERVRPWKFPWAMEISRTWKFPWHMEISMGAAFSVAMEISRAWKFPWPCIIGLMQLHSTLFLMECFYHLHGIICWCRASR